MTFTKKVFLSLLSSFFFIGYSGLVYARGNTAARQLAEIDGHLEEKNYNEALSLLSDFIRDNPEQFDQAQKRIDAVLNARNNLTDLADELIYVIEHDPENDERKLELIQQIESVEINPSPQMKSFLESTRRAAEFAVNRIKYQNIITEGAALTDKGNFTDAVLSQLKGFSVYYDTFLRETDGATVAAVNDRLDEVRAQAARFGEISAEAERAIADLDECLRSDDAGGTQRALGRAETALKEYARLRNTVADAGYDFQTLFAEIAAEQGLETEASYLPFAWRFILGSASEEHSGILGAMDLLWHSLIEKEKTVTLAAVQRHLDTFAALAVTAETAAVVTLSSPLEKELYSIRLFLDAALTLDGLYAQLITADRTPYLSPEPDFTRTVLEVAVVCTWIQGILINDASYQKSLAVVQKNPIESVSDTCGSAVAAGDFSWVTRMTEQVGVLKELYDGAVEYSAAIMKSTDNQQLLVELPSASSFSTGLFMQSVLNFGLQLQSESRDTLEYLLASLQQYVDLAAGSIAESRTASYRDCHALLNEDLDPAVASYPQQVIPEAERLLGEFARTAERLESLDRLVSGVCDASAVSAARATLASLSASTAALETKAQERVLQANRIYAEGELRYSEAKTAIARDDYTSARNSIQKAGSRYAESFLYREDASLRAASDAKLIALGEEINRLENERIVLEVRRLKKEAKSEYYAGNFESADSLLQQARARWLITNVDDDPEIVQLQALVGTALSMKTGRTLSPSAPLYPEMSQTLNIAHSFYSEGEALLKKGQRQEGVAALQKAQQKIRELQLVYPLNQEASLMSLQIDKLIDPAAFEVYFAQKIAAAKEEYKDAAKQRQVYADLLDLYEINPSYKGLKDFIYTVEIELGVRQKPIDRTAQIQSESLYKEAVALYNKNSRDEINLRSALSKVDEALQKNPDNEDAQTLKDRINIALGGSGSVVLPSEAESLYQKAVQELQKGNTIQAAAIVMQLMQNPDYAKSAKILDLKKKVDSLL